MVVRSMIFSTTKFSEICSFVFTKSWPPSKENWDSRFVYEIWETSI